MNSRFQKNFEKGALWSFGIDPNFFGVHPTEPASLGKLKQTKEKRGHALVTVNSGFRGGTPTAPAQHVPHCAGDLFFKGVRRAKLTNAHARHRRRSLSSPGSANISLKMGKYYLFVGFISQRETGSSRDKPQRQDGRPEKKLDARNHSAPRHARRRGACRTTPNGWPPGLRTQPLMHASSSPATRPPCPSTPHCCSRHCPLHFAQHWRRGLGLSQACTLVPAARRTVNAMSNTGAADGEAVVSKVGVLLSACTMLCLGLPCTLAFVFMGTILVTVATEARL